MAVYHRFSRAKLRDAGPFDVAVVGTGMASLVTSALLSNVGFRVLVLERHDQPGGAMHDFSVSNEHGHWLFDAGVQICAGGLVKSHLFRRLTGASITWCPFDSQFEVGRVMRNSAEQVNMSAVDIKAPAQCSPDAASFRTRFQHEERSLKRFDRSCRFVKTFGAMTLFAIKLFPSSGGGGFRKAFFKLLGWPLRSLHDWLNSESVVAAMERCGLSTELQQEMLIFVCNMGIRADKYPFLAYALNRYGNNFFGSGFAAYPRGGGSKLPLALCEQIQKSGGLVLCNSKADQILVAESTHSVIDRLSRCLRGSCEQKKKVVGLQVNGVEIKVPRVISGLSMQATYERLLPEDVCNENHEVTAIKSALKELPLSEAWVQMFVGFDSSTRELELPNRRTWVVPSMNYIGNWSMDNVDADFPVVYISFPSAKDPFLPFDHKATAEVMAPVKYAWFKDYEVEQSATPVQENRKRRTSGGYEAYSELKTNITDRLVKVLEMQFPQTKGRIVYKNLGTPLTFNSYLGTTQGDFYGLAVSRERFQASFAGLLRPTTPLAGFYITGQDLMRPTLGSSMWAGVLTAFAISKLSVLRVLPDILHDALML